MKRLLAVAGMALLTVNAGAVETAHTRATLLLSANTARPGDTIQAAVRLQMDSGWHTYWRNGGDSGGPTKIEWQLPPGISAGDIQWPVPEKYNFEGLTTYVYHNEAVLLVPLKLASDLKSGPLELKAKVSWLECEKVCLPGSEAVSASLVVGETTGATIHGALFEATKTKLPADGSGLNLRAAWDGPATGDSRKLILEWLNAPTTAIADFFPYANENFAVGTAAEKLSAPAGQVRLRVEITKFAGDWPAQVTGLLLAETGGQRSAYGVTIAMAGAAAADASTHSLALMLLYAFIGGLILNIMPCVLPVIALKILGFVGQAKESPGRVRQLGLVYAVGVLVSFLCLAALVIGVKAAGQAAGWGMQFSSPQFTIVFTVLVTLVALNLFGVFEVTLGGGVMSAAGNLAARHGPAGAFFNGVLATVLATPCTAPFLSVALGFAFSQSAAVIVLMFLTVGAGLASPYVVLSWFPAWLKWLPKPGVWMEHFKTTMGFPMLATALWLASLVSDRYGERAWWLGIFLLFVAIAAWIVGTFIQRGSQSKVAALLIALGVLALGYFWILEERLQWRSPLDTAQVSATSLRNAPKGYDWQAWRPDAVNQARAEGRPVIIDFTAKWCITCNTIVKPALERPAVIAELAKRNVAAFLADYTDYGTTNAAEMKRYNRAAVPLVLVFPPGNDVPPILLPDPNPLLGSGSYAEVILTALGKASP